MNLERIQSEIGFSDAELEAYTKTGDRLVVHVRAWNDTSVTVTFQDVIRLQDNLFFQISDLCCMKGGSEFLTRALARHYDAIPSEHPFKHYQFLDDGGAIQGLKSLPRRFVSTRDNLNLTHRDT